MFQRFNLLDRSRLQRRDSPRFEPQNTPTNLTKFDWALLKLSHIVSQVTWRRYWASAAPKSEYLCPSCKRRSKITTQPSWIQPTSHAIQIGLPFLLILLPIHWIGLVIFLFVGFPIIFMIDRWLDAKYGVLYIRSSELIAEQGSAHQSTTAS